jgi:hypothetical protein
MTCAHCLPGEVLMSMQEVICFQVGYQRHSPGSISVDKGSRLYTAIICGFRRLSTALLRSDLFETR